MGERRNKLPVLYVKGTHYEVGYEIGWNFKNIIQEFLNTFSYLNDILLPIYESKIGRQEYEETLLTTQNVFPQYVEELRGLSDGAFVPFYKLFLLHIDGIITHNEQDVIHSGKSGCSSILVNIRNNFYLGHNEDALPETANYTYVVNAHIIDSQVGKSWNKTEEKFVAYCYAGDLPGYCMGYNKHGLIHSVNILWPKPTIAGKIPCHFYCRAILGAENQEEAINMLKGCGVGCGDGFGINLIYVNNYKDISMYNIEIAPSNTKQESEISIYKVPENSWNLHCNRFQRIKIMERFDLSSIRREATFTKLPNPTNIRTLLNILSDESDPEYKFFRSGNYGDEDVIKTLAVGVFDLNNHTWSIYTENPRMGNQPLIKFSLDLS